MELKNIEELEQKKAQLKSEIAELEGILKFKNPRKSFEAITDGATEKYLGGLMNSNLSEKILPLTGTLLGGALKIGSSKILDNVKKKALNKKVLTKGAIALGVLSIAPFLMRKAKKEVEEFQKRETAKSLGKLI